MLSFLAFVRCLILLVVLAVNIYHLLMLSDISLEGHLPILWIRLVSVIVGDLMDWDSHLRLISIIIVDNPVLLDIIHFLVEESFISAPALIEALVWVPFRLILLVSHLLFLSFSLLY